VKDYERFLTIKRELEEAQKRIPELQEEIRAKSSKQGELEEKARRAVALDESNAAELRAARDENERAVIRFEDELVKTQEKLKTQHGEIGAAKEAALEDLRGHYHGVAEPLVKELARLLRAAAEFEGKLKALKIEADEKRVTVTPYPGGLVVMPAIRFLLGETGYLEDGRGGGFLKDLKDKGFDI